MYWWHLFRVFYEIASEKMCNELRGYIGRGENVLDLGCGSGIFTKKLQEFFGVNVLGIDIIDHRICNIPFLKFNGREIPLKDDSFHTVLISFVLHHTEDPIHLLKEAKRIAKRIIIFEDIPVGFLSKIRCMIHANWWNFFTRKSAPLNFFTEQEWKMIFQELNLSVLTVKDFLHPLGWLDPVKKKIFILQK